MKKLFIHQPLFRVFSPIFSGIIVYLLVLLINNNISQIQEQFLGEELYVFIGLNYCIQESIRIILVALNRKSGTTNPTIQIATQIFISVVTCILIVSLFMYLFYKFVEGYSINSEELLVFNSIFVVICIIYVSLFVSNEYLHKINSKKLQHEKLIKKNIEEEFLKFKREINPDLFFDSLEELLVLIEKDKEQVEFFIDHLSVLYRYILNKKEKQLVSIYDELNIAKDLIELINGLPLRNVSIETKVSSEFLMVPGTVMAVLELISRTSIPLEKPVKVSIYDDNSKLIFSYIPNDKITIQLDINQFESLQHQYAIYSDQTICINENDNKRTIEIPKLVLA